MRTNRNTWLLLFFVLIGASAMLTPSTARADRFRPVYVGFGAGPYFDFDCCQVHGRVSGELGWHFGSDDTGFVMRSKR